MAHEKVYGICENKCRVEIPTKGEYQNLISQLDLYQPIYFGLGSVEGVLNEVTGVITFEDSYEGMYIIPNDVLCLPVVDSTIDTGGIRIVNSGDIAYSSYKATVSDGIIKFIGMHYITGGYTQKHDMGDVGVLVIPYGHEYE